MTKHKDLPAFDVRSPGEYAHAHIPNVLSLPLFSDMERAEIGTAYKQQNRQIAVKIGLEYFRNKMLTIIDEVTSKFPLESYPKLLVHCWRGGMRSGAVAWLLSLYGYELYTLIGGYKSYRKWALLQFEKNYDCQILGGYTGSGKTKILHQMKAKNLSILDLELLANHRGSAFGKNKNPQPSQEQFENLLALELFHLQQNNFWLEDESRRIGDCNIPKSLWEHFRTKDVYFLDNDFEERLDNIVKEYSQDSKEKFENGILRIQKRLGPVATKTALMHLEKNEWRECFSILLHYYDKYYSKSMQMNRNVEKQIKKISVHQLSTQEIIDKLCQQ